MNVKQWRQTVLTSPGFAEAWATISDMLRETALGTTFPVELHNETVAPDRLLAESAWQHKLMPPCVLTANGHHMAVGQKNW